MSHSVPTLFDKYGGVPAVRRLVRQFHERFAASPALRRYFENVDAEKFIKHHAELIAYTLGRPAASFEITPERGAGSKTLVKLPDKTTDGGHATVFVEKCGYLLRHAATLKQ